MLLIGNGLVLVPCGCLLLFLLLIMFNPMQLAFVTEFRVENRTEETLRVTPIGTVGQGGSRCPLPIFLRDFPAVPDGSRGHFPVSPGETITIYYDWDDIQFSEIVVEDSQGELRRLIVDPNPTEHQYHPPDEDHFVIDNLEDLGPVGARVLGAYRQAEPRTPLDAAIYSLPLLPFASFALLALLLFLLPRRSHRKAGSRGLL